MGRKILDTKRSTCVKDKTTIFNFPLSKAGRYQLEELADMWSLSLAGVIRRSLDEAYRSAKANTDTPRHVDAKESKLATLETLLAMHGELLVIKANTTKILAAIPTAKDEVRE